MDEQPLDSLVAFFKALGDLSRLRLVGILAQRESTGEELAAMLDLHPATISHHMTRLQRAGLVDARASGYYTVYRLKTEKLQTIARQVLSSEGLTSFNGNVDPMTFDRKVLQDFTSSAGQLKSIPAQRKKRAAILRHIVQQFQPDRRYTEREVNAVLKRFHEDTASLRRELVSEKLLARDREAYWRTGG
jgi:predicted transcriptional regulator